MILAMRLLKPSMSPEVRPCFTKPQTLALCFRKPRAILGSLTEDTLERVVAWILPLGGDLDAVADLEGFGAVAGDRLLHGRG